MSEPSWPEWGADMPKYHPWHLWTSQEGAHHAGYLLDTVIGPSVEQPNTQQVYEILRCEPCLTIHATPLPSPEALSRYYTDRFYQEDKPESLARAERDRPWWEQCVWEPILRQCHAATHGGTTDVPRLLDIGTGAAISLDVGQALGMATWGIEPNKVMADRAQQRGHQVYHGTLATFTTQETWDIITAYEVLEHQSEPEAFLLRCYELLAPGGILALCVPNDYSPVQIQARRQLKLAPWWLAAPQHQFYWTPKTLQLQVRRCGFRIFDLRGTFPIDQYLLNGYNYIGNDRMGRLCHAWRMQDELYQVKYGFWSQREAQYRCQLQAQRLGREIVLLAQKEA